MQPDQYGPPPGQQIPTGGQPYQQPSPNAPMYPTGSKLKHHINALLIPLVIIVVLLLVSFGFGLWAFMGRQTFKNNVDRIVKTEVDKAVSASVDEQKKAFEEQSKSPNKEYNGPAAFGGIKIVYPKTWSAQIDEPNKGTTPISGYFHPDYVPSRTSGTAFALRVEVVEYDYAAVLKKYEADAKKGKVKVSPISATKVAGAVGSRIDGEIDKDMRGSIVLFPMRDKTLILRTESEIFVKDFDSIVLANLVFAP